MDMMSCCQFATDRVAALRFSAVATALPSDVELTPLQGEARPAEEWTTTFHLVFVVVDPFTYESAWILESAARILRAFRGADCRVCWLVTATAEQAEEFLGPWADEFLTFVDPERTAVEAMDLGELPALVHLDQSLQVEGAAEGWDPEAWDDVAENLARRMSWSKPVIPAQGDPAPYAGSPALG